LGRTQGDVLGSLLAFRSLLEAVAKLHEKGYVHRDIKPDNIFVADDGHLVLGDFGLVIEPGAADGRLTDTYENVGSRDWMPGWAMGLRILSATCCGHLLANNAVQELTRHEWQENT
jgi:hypothetical protein